MTSASYAAEIRHQARWLMAVVLLDTTVLIDVLRGRPGPVERLRDLRRRGDTPATCAVNVDEIHRGLKGGRELAAVQALVDGLAILPLDSAQGAMAGTWRWEHAARGITLTQADCLVAAAAAAAGARLATGNPKDFPMPDLVVEHWPVGS